MRHRDPGTPAVIYPHSTNQRLSKPLTRGQFLSIAWVGALGVLAVETAISLLNFLKPAASGGFGGLVYAGKVEEFPVGSVNRVLSGRFFVVSTEQGLIALWQRCTHLGCAIPWAESEGQFHCPCHGSLFDRMGLVTGGPAPRPMDTFPIVIKGDEVWVDTSKPTQRTGFEPSQLTQV
jgi:cytochrome b6-f complex iron-sulfur subunit